MEQFEWQTVINDVHKSYLVCEHVVVGVSDIEDNGVPLTLGPNFRAGEVHEAPLHDIALRELVGVIEGDHEGAMEGVKAAARGFAGDGVHKSVILGMKVVKEQNGWGQHRGGSWNRNRHEKVRQRLSASIRGLVSSIHSFPRYLV